MEDRVKAKGIMEKVIESQYDGWRNIGERNNSNKSKWWKDIKEMCKTSNENWFNDNIV